MKPLDDLKREVKTEFLENGPWFRDDLLDAVIDHLHAQGLLMVWQPIETAPKYGTEIILLNSAGVTSGWFEDGRWRVYRNGDLLYYLHPAPTAWMPLPAAQKGCRVMTENKMPDKVFISEFTAAVIEEMTKEKCFYPAEPVEALLRQAREALIKSRAYAMSGKEKDVISLEAVNAIDKFLGEKNDQQQ